MAAGRFIVGPYFPARDRDGQLQAGALLYVYENKTTNKVTVYSDEALTVLQSNPAVANSSGQFPPVWAEAGTAESPTPFTVSVTSSTGASLGNPSTFDDFYASLNWTNAEITLAEAAATAAEGFADDAASSAAEAAADLVAIEEIAAGSPDAPSILNKANKNADNVSNYAEEWVTAIGALSDADVPPLLLAGTLTNQGNGPYWVAMRESDATLFVLLGNDHALKAYSVSDPALPSYLGEVVLGTSGAGPAYVAVRGNYAYATDQNTNTLRVIDATNPASMTVVGTVVYEASGGGGGRCDISPDGTKLCVGGTESGTNANKALVIDVSTPSAPAVLGRTAAIGSTHRGTAWVSNTVFAVASRDDKTIFLVDASTPSAPVSVGIYVTPTGLGSVTTPVKWDAGSSTLFYGNFGTGYLIGLDVSTPSAPTLKGSVAIPAAAEQIAFTDTGRALVACRNNNTLALVDISDPASMTLLASQILPGTTTPGVGWHEGYAYVTCAGDTLNGKIFTYAVEPSLSEAIETLQDATASVAANAATLTANTFSGTQTISAATALILSNGSCRIRFGTTSPDDLIRVAAASYRWDVRLDMLGFDLYNSGAILRSKVNRADAQFSLNITGNGEMAYGSGAASADCRTGRISAGVWGVNIGSFAVTTAGQGLRVKEGSNAKQGTATLVAGTVTVANTSVTANSRIFLTAQDNNTTGSLRVSARTASTGFDITSSNGADTGVVAYEIFEPA